MRNSAIDGSNGGFDSPLIPDTECRSFAAVPAYGESDPDVGRVSRDVSDGE